MVRMGISTRAKPASRASPWAKSPSLPSTRRGINRPPSIRSPPPRRSIFSPPPPPASLAARLPPIDARGYEFELEMLIAARQSGVALVEIPIRTIYQPGNKSSHFNPLTDSMKIYFVLLRFSSVSLMAALLDNLIFYLVWKRSGHILGAQVAARLVSVAFYYSMVRARVFASREAHRVLLPKFLLLVVSSGTASYLGIQFATTHLGVTAMPAKLFVETLLFFVNFAVQRLFIFHGRQDLVPGERA